MERIKCQKTRQYALIISKHEKACARDQGDGIVQLLSLEESTANFELRQVAHSRPHAKEPILGTIVVFRVMAAAVDFVSVRSLPLLVQAHRE